MKTDFQITIAKRNDLSQKEQKWVRVPKVECYKQNEKGYIRSLYAGTEWAVLRIA